MFFYKKEKILIELKNNLNTHLPIILLILLLSTTYILEGFLKSGCVINFIQFSCIENEKFFGH